MTELILGSGSPRRARLLAQAGFAFTVVVRPIDETPLDGESPRDLVCRLAAAKALAVQEELGAAGGGSAHIVLAADTVVAVDGHVMGKPVDRSHAAHMLRRLSGRGHDVLTGWAVLAAGREHLECTRTEVTFRGLNPDEIGAYVASGEPMDKAGAYAIQGGAAHFVTALAGPYENVVGLPLGEIIPVLGRFGVLPTRLRGSGTPAIEG
jgi:septum formation protein